MDVTKHDPEVPHGTNKQSVDKYFRHTKQWYELFGNVCPTCQAPALFKEKKNA